LKTAAGQGENHPKLIAFARVSARNPQRKAMTMFASNEAHKQQAMNCSSSLCGGFSRGLASRVVTVTTPVGVPTGIIPGTTGWEDRKYGMRSRSRSTAVRTPACA
jgi:hypothetical protein